MAIVFLALNGDGLGHLVRTVTICQSLRAVDERPVIFSQGVLSLNAFCSFPGKTVPSLWKVEESVRDRVASEIRSLAEISLPAVLVEDTHPNPIRLPRNLRRILIVRPTTFEYMSLLKDRYNSVYSCFLITDAPDSPTWPYSKEDTLTLLRWDKWIVVGPIYRSPSEADLLEVRQRYAMQDGQRICVVSMGGGGQSKDVRPFLEFASRVAHELRRTREPVRFIFVQGPYFSAELPIDCDFEVVPQELKMPALLALADGAIIRPGFNTTWECLSGATPFMPFIGTTFAEPVPKRLQGLASHGLLAPDVNTFWNDREWRSRFQGACQQLVQQYPGRPAGSFMQSLILGKKAPTRLAQRRSTLLTSYRNGNLFYKLGSYFRYRAPFVIRIDDVVSLDDTLTWLLSLLSTRKMHASLEVVPYLSDLNEASMRYFDREHKLFEMSQHGYAHVPRSDSDGHRVEFASTAAAHDEADLRRGNLHMQEVFQHRFCGGFSPPYDGLPVWLPSVWQRAGGRYVSTMHRQTPTETSLPVIRAGTDIWDWYRGRPRPVEELLREESEHARTDGYGGIVLHPRCLRSRLSRSHLIRALDAFEGRGFRSTVLSGLAFDHCSQGFSP